MPDYYAHIAKKVTDNDVEAAIAEAKVAAIAQLGGSDVTLCRYEWTDKDVYTKWMRTVPDTPNQG